MPRQLQGKIFTVLTGHLGGDAQRKDSFKVIMYTIEDIEIFPLHQGLGTFPQEVGTFPQEAGTSLLGVESFCRDLRNFHQGGVTFHRDEETFLRGVGTFPQGVETFPQDPNLSIITEIEQEKEKG